MSRTRLQILERAMLHVGHLETSENDSILIRAWLRLCGVLVPAPWCAAFASWCLGVAQAGAVALGRLFPSTNEPEPGDLMWFETGSWQGHCGIVVLVESERVLCIEGNSANRVRYVWRRRDQVKFARTCDASYVGDIYPPVSALDAPTVLVQMAGTR